MKFLQEPALKLPSSAENKSYACKLHYIQACPKCTSIPYLSTTSTCLSIHLPTHSPTHLPIYLSTYLPIHLPIYLPIHLCIYSSIYLPIYLSIYSPLLLYFLLYPLTYEDKWEGFFLAEESPLDITRFRFCLHLACRRWDRTKYLEAY